VTIIIVNGLPTDSLSQLCIYTVVHKTSVKD